MRQDKYKLIVDYIIKNQEKFYRLAYSYVQNQNDALDVVQNAICKGLENYDALRNIHAVKTWFYRILVNESINFIKKNRKEVVLEDFITEGLVYFEESFEQKNDVFEEINRLPIDAQNIIKLRFYEELSLNEIAEVMDMNINTVKAKLYRALKLLKQEVSYE